MGGIIRSTLLWKNTCCGRAGLALALLGHRALPRGDGTGWLVPQGWKHFLRVGRANWLAPRQRSIPQGQVALEGAHCIVGAIPMAGQGLPLHSWPVPFFPRQMVMEGLLHGSAALLEGWQC